jgi:hypothetical protein
MEKSKIYLAVVSFGSHDSQYTRNIKAFQVKEEAQAYVKKADRVFEAMKSHVRLARENIRELEYSPGYMTALNIWSAHMEFGEFNRIYVEEMEII